MRKKLVMIFFALLLGSLYGDPLFEAIKNNDLETVKQSIPSEYSPNDTLKSKEGNFIPLVLAVDEKHDRLVEYFLNSGGDVNLKNGANQPVFNSICQWAEADLILLALKKEADSQSLAEKVNTALTAYMNRKHEKPEIEVAHDFLKKILGLNEAFKNSLDFFETLMSRVKEHPVWVEYFWNNCSKELKDEIENDPDFTSYIYTEDFDAISFLVNHGVDINTPDVDGRLPIDVAMASNDKMLADFLLELGADPAKGFPYTQQQYKKLFATKEEKSLKTVETNGIYFTVKEAIPIDNKWGFKYYEIYAVEKGAPVALYNLYCVNPGHISNVDNYRSNVLFSGFDGESPYHAEIEALNSLKMVNLNNDGLEDIVLSTNGFLFDSALKFENWHLILNYKNNTLYPVFSWCEKERFEGKSADYFHQYESQCSFYDNDRDGFKETIIKQTRYTMKFSKLIDKQELTESIYTWNGEAYELTSTESTQAVAQ